MYWDKNEQVQYEGESQDKKAMYEKTKELKRDPVAYKELEAQALSLITPEQRKSESMPFYRDKKLRELIMEMIQEQGSNYITKTIMKLKELKEYIKDIPDDVDVYTERVHDIYFDKH